MAAERSALKHKRKYLILKLIAIAFVGYVLFTLVNYQVRINRVKKLNQAVSDQIEETEVVNKALEDALEDEEELLRRKAEQEGYVDPNEEQYYDIAGN